MKNIPTPIKVMEIMFEYIIDAYNNSAKKEKGVIQFYLKHNDTLLNFYIEANGKSMRFVEGENSVYDVSLTSSLYDWIELASGHLNPIWGVISRKLKFKGDTKYFKKLIPEDLYKVNLTPYSDPVNSFEKDPVNNWTKPKNVLIIDASSRGGKGYTNLYCKELVKSFLSEGVEVNHLLLSQYKIHHCMGCLQCWLVKNGKCIINDDAEKVYNEWDNADLVVYAFPLYAYNVPGMLKNFIDRGIKRQFPYFEPGIDKMRHPRRNKTNKSFMVFSICGFPDNHQFDSVRQLFKLYSHSSHFPLVAEIYRPGGMFLVNNPFQFKKLNNFLEGLNEAGSEVITKGMITRQTKKKLNCEIKIDEFCRITNKYWDNLVKENRVNY